MKIQIRAADWRTPFEPESRGLLHSTSLVDVWQLTSFQRVKLETSLGFSPDSSSLLDTFRDAAGASLLECDVIRKGLSRRGTMTIALARVYSEAKISIARWIYRQKITIRDRGNVAKDYFARRLPSWRPFNMSIPLDSPDSSSFANVPKSCAFAETRG